LLEFSWYWKDWPDPTPANEGAKIRGILAVFLIKGETKTVKVLTVVGLGTTRVTFVLAKALRLDREMVAEVAERVWGVKDWRGREDCEVT
jgi:hypothetical protein